MEHRWGQRMPIDMAVRLIGSPSAIGTGRIRDVSVTGAFVQTNLKLPLLALVQIEPVAMSPSASDTRRLPAYVTRSGVDGIGVEWCDLAPAVVDEFLCTTSEQVPAMMQSAIARSHAFQ